MTRTAPPPPNRGSFYTVVCGGTWLDRDKYNQAVVDYKSEDFRYTDIRDALAYNAFRQSQTPSLAGQSFLQSANLQPKPLLPAFLSGLEPAAQGLLSFLSKLLALQPKTETSLVGLGLQTPSAKREGLLAQLFNAMLGNRREFQQFKVSKEEQEQRNANDFDLAAVDLFSLGKLSAPQGRSSMAGEDNQGGQ